MREVFCKAPTGPWFPFTATPDRKPISNESWDPWWPGSSLVPGQGTRRRGAIATPAYHRPLGGGDNLRYCRRKPATGGPRRHFATGARSEERRVGKEGRRGRAT